MRNLDSLNDAIGRIGVISEFAFNQVKQNVAKENVEGFHEALGKEAERLSTAAKTLSNTAGKLIRQYGAKLMDEQIQLARLADIAIDTFMIAAVLSRANSVIEKNGGPEKNAQELMLARLVIRNAKARINQNAYNTKANRDEDVKALAAHVCEMEKYPFEMTNYK